MTVVDVERGELRPAQRVVITGNRIQTVGNTSAVKAPQGAQIVDARGKYLIPGLWDMHTHSEHAVPVFYPLFLANGITGIRDASSSVPLDTLRLWRRETLAATRVGPPRQVLSGPMLQTDCSPGMIKCVSVGRNPDSAQFAARVRHVVDSLKGAGADMIKVRDVFPATVFFTIADEARRAGIPVGGHAWDSVDVEVSNRGARIIDHLVPWYPVPTGLRTWCWAAKQTASLEQCQPVTERFRRNQTWVVPTLTLYVNADPARKWTSQSRALAERARRQDAEFFAGRSAFRGNWLRDTALAGAPPSAANGATRPNGPGVLRLMQRTDFPIAAGTDVAPEFWSWMLPGFVLHTELAISVAEGLTPLKALQSVTLEPARLLHLTDSLGTVTKGKLADLVLLDADPLADITNTTTIRAVVANGHYFDRAALDHLIADARAAAKPAGLGWP